MIHYISHKTIHLSNDYIGYTDETKFRQVFDAWFRPDKWIGFDTETNGLDAHVNKLLLTSFGDANTQFVLDKPKLP